MEYGMQPCVAAGHTQTVFPGFHQQWQRKEPLMCCSPANPIPTIFRVKHVGSLTHLFTHYLSNSCAWSLAAILWILRGFLNFQGWNLYTSSKPFLILLFLQMAQTLEAWAQETYQKRFYDLLLPISISFVSVLFFFYCLEINTDLKGKEKRSQNSS